MLMQRDTETETDTSGYVILRAKKKKKNKGKKGWGKSNLCRRKKRLNEVRTR